MHVSQHQLYQQVTLTDSFAGRAGMIQLMNGVTWENGCPVKELGVTLSSPRHDHCIIDMPEETEGEGEESHSDLESCSYYSSRSTMEEVEDRETDTDQNKVDSPSSYQPPSYLAERLADFPQVLSWLKHGEHLQLITTEEDVSQPNLDNHALRTLGDKCTEGQTTRPQEKDTIIDTIVFPMIAPQFMQEVNAGNTY